HTSLSRDWSSDVCSSDLPAAPQDVTVQCADDVPAPVGLTAIDNCDGEIPAQPIDDITPGDCPNRFTVVRTWTFTDLCGNTSSVRSEERRVGKWQLCDTAR